MKKVIIHNALFFLAVFCTWHCCGAQSGQNPFEVIHRLEPPAGPERIDTPSINGNPFEITPSDMPVVSPPPGPRGRKSVAKPSPPSTAYRTFLLVVFLINLILMTLLITVFRHLIVKSYKAFLNDKLLNQLYREWDAGVQIPFILLYIFFLINAGLFLFLLGKHYQWAIPGSNVLQLVYCIGIVSMLIFLKHLVLNLLGYIFPIGTETALYNFTIVIFGIILGLFLAVSNIFLAYGAGFVSQFFLYLSFIVLLMVYGFRYLRGLFIANKFILFHKFHFLLYICTVEIAPVLVLLRWVIPYP